MVKSNSTDRPRGILTKADREYLLSDKSGYTHQQQSNAKGRITERVANALLDFRILENHLDDEIREDVFEMFDVSRMYDDDVDLHGEPMDYVGTLTDMLAFVFRETREGTGHHPQFARYLESAIVQGQFEPGTTYYGPHNVEIDVTFEKVQPEAINIESISERIENDGIDSLTEAEMREYLKILARSEHLDTDEVRKEFTEWVDEFDKEYPTPPNRITDILAHVDGRNPFEARIGLETEESDE